MAQKRDKSLIHVMSLDEYYRWHQPIRPLREWFQYQLVRRVQAAAVRSGYRRAFIFDASETLLWRSR
jgi:hypothetical protein